MGPMHLHTKFVFQTFHDRQTVASLWIFVFKKKGSLLDEIETLSKNNTYLMIRAFLFPNHPHE